MPPSRTGSGARLGSFTCIRGCHWEASCLSQSPNDSKCIDVPLMKKHSNDTAASLLPCPCPAEVNTEYQVQLMCWWPAAIEAMCCFGGVELPCFNDIESSMVNSNHPRDEQACSGFPTTLRLVSLVKVSILLHWNFTFYN